MPCVGAEAPLCWRLGGRREVPKRTRTTPSMELTDAVQLDASESVTQKIGAVFNGNSRI